MTPHVCVVILNWNGALDTLRCISAAQRLDYAAKSVVVVDNGSRDDSVTRIRAETPGVTLIESPINAGFGAGNNLGIARALRDGADYVWVINNDVDFDADTLTKLVETAATTHADLVGAWMFDAVGETSLFCRNAAPLGYLSSRSLRPTEEDGDAWTTFEVSGAAVFLSRDLLQSRLAKVGYFFDGSLFLYCEELELALWCRANGHRVVTARRARIRHRVGASASRLAELTRRHYLIRNRIVVLRRYLNAPAAWLAIGAFSIMTLLRSLLMHCVADDLRAIRAGMGGESGKLERARDH